MKYVLLKAKDSDDIVIGQTTDKKGVYLVTKCLRTHFDQAMSEGVCVGVNVSYDKPPHFKTVYKNGNLEKVVERGLMDVF